MDLLAAKVSVSYWNNTIFFGIFMTLLFFEYQQLISSGTDSLEDIWILKKRCRQAGAQGADLIWWYVINMVDHGASSDLSDLSSSACFYCHFSISHGRRSQAQIIINTCIFAHLRRTLRSQIHNGCGLWFYCQCLHAAIHVRTVAFAESKKPDKGQAHTSCCNR